MVEFCRSLLISSLFGIVLFFLLFTSIRVTADSTTTVDIVFPEVTASDIANSRSANSSELFFNQQREKKSEENSLSISTTTRFCRFGVNFAPTEPITNYNIAALRAGWYINYVTSQSPLRPNGIEFAQMIHLSQINTGPGYRYAPGKSTLIEILQANPGSKIYVSNEPDRIIYQDDVHPHVYAEAYHELYHLIKSVDPTARVFAGSVDPNFRF
ncbi:hypothetical protein KFU94_15995 [Chloroflexi bacterium TSY]|nr:hypothetical protein [Chloroflexi bacterium TSY]